MATKLGMKRTEPRKSLNKTSDKAKKELLIWREVKLYRINLLQQKYDYIPCEYCRKRIMPQSELYCAEGHHNNHDRRQNTLENCRIVHRVCNQRIEDLNIKDVLSLL